jgi:CheY-like chemotaxis protein
MAGNPRRALEIDQSKLRSPSQPENVARLVVLVVEDRDDTRAMLTMLLEIYGCRVLEAEDGLAAILLAESARPDLILMNMRLPLVDGLAATRRIRERSWSCQVTIVAITGDASVKFQLETIAAGCSECFVKPIDFD